MDTPSSAKQVLQFLGGFVVGVFFIFFSFLGALPSLLIESILNSEESKINPYSYLSSSSTMYGYYIFKFGFPLILVCLAFLKKKYYFVAGLISVFVILFLQYIFSLFS